VSTYVATGGTANLSAGQPPPIEVDEYLTPGQKLAITIVLLLLLPAILAVVAEGFGFDGEIVAVPAILLPVGIMWAIFHYKAVMRRRQTQAIQAANALPAQGQYISEYGINLGMQQPPADAYSYPQQLPQSRTNPLPEPTRGSVIEDETQRLREGR
jgi:hypothetical protein